ncbi:MAG: amidohydrolase family protein [Candidatus Glassbacteria bacterium]|nr:amidohydrolase family protein [Candidatus Glassbacteria bacterium]
MRIVDFHTHVFPDKVAAGAIPKMEQTSGYKAFTDGTVGGLVASMEAAGIDKSVALPVATNPEKVSSVNRFGASIAEPRLCMFGALHPKASSWHEHLEEVLGYGMAGIKLHPDYQDFYPDDPDLLPFFAACRDSGLLVFFHAGGDLSFEPPNRGGPARIASLLEALPGIKIFAAHMGGFRMWDEVEEHLLGKPVFMDTSFAIGYLSDDRLRGMIRRHGTEYVLFGTDSPWMGQSEEVKNVLGLGLGSAAEERIFFANALRLIPELAA